MSGSLRRPLAALAFLAPILLSVPAACGPFHLGGGSQPAYIVFTNESLDQADVYGIVPAGDAIRIGTVMAGRTDTLKVPTDLLAPQASVNIVARILARGIAPRTGPVSIAAGETYAVRLPPDEKLLSFLPAQ